MSFHSNRISQVDVLNSRTTPNYNTGYETAFVRKKTLCPTPLFSYHSAFPLKRCHFCLLSMEIHPQLGWYSQALQGLLYHSSSGRSSDWGNVCHGNQISQSVELAVSWQGLLFWQ